MLWVSSCLVMSPFRLQVARRSDGYKLSVQKDDEGRWRTWCKRHQCSADLGRCCFRPKTGTSTACLIVPTRRREYKLPNKNTVLWRWGTKTVSAQITKAVACHQVISCRSFAFVQKPRQGTNDSFWQTQKMTGQDVICFGEASSESSISLTRSVWYMNGLKEFKGGFGKSKVEQSWTKLNKFQRK